MESLKPRSSARWFGTAALCVVFGLGCDLGLEAPPRGDIDVLLMPPDPAACPDLPCAVQDQGAADGALRVRVLDGDRLVEQVDTRYRLGALPPIPTTFFTSGLQILVEAIRFDGAGAFTVASGASVPLRPEQRDWVDARWIPMTRTERFVAAYGVDPSELESSGRLPLPSDPLQAFFLREGRVGHTLTPMPTLQGVLAVGGVVAGRSGAGRGGTRFEAALDHIEFFDEWTGRWVAVARDGCEREEQARGDCGLRLGIPRAFHATVLLSDGRVLVVGGMTDDGADGFRALDSIEVIEIDPQTARGTVRTLPERLSVPRMMHTATLLPRGEVAVVGGFPGRYTADATALGSLDRTMDVELIESGPQGFRVRAGGPRLEFGRAMHDAVYMTYRNTGLVVSGGLGAAGETVPTFEFFYQEPETGTFARATASVPRRLASPRYGHRSVLLREERGEEASRAQQVLFVGGFGAADPQAEFLRAGRNAVGEVEILRIDPQANAVRIDAARAVDLPFASGWPSVVVLPLSEEVLVMGGLNDEARALDDAVRLVRQGSGVWGTRAVPGGLREARAGAPAVVLQNHLVLVAGGMGAGDATRSDAEYYNPNDFRFLVVEP